MVAPKKARVKQHLMNLMIWERCVNSLRHIRKQKHDIIQQGEGVDKARLKLTHRHKIESPQKKAIYEYMQQQADIKTYQNNLSGDPAFWQGLQVKAGQG